MVLSEGSYIAQQGTPSQILGAPADDFVRGFIGAERADRTLHTVTVNGRQLAVDANGKPVGVLEP